MSLEPLALIRATGAAAARQLSFPWLSTMTFPCVPRLSPSHCAGRGRGVMQPNPFPPCPPSPLLPSPHPAPINIYTSWCMARAWTQSGHCDHCKGQAAGCCWDSKEGRRQRERQSLIFVLCRGDGGQPQHSGIRAEEAQLSLSGAEEEVTHRPAQLLHCQCTAAVLLLHCCCRKSPSPPQVLCSPGACRAPEQVLQAGQAVALSPRRATPSHPRL